jgi:hypothetical protein
MEDDLDEEPDFDLRMAILRRVGCSVIYEIDLSADRGSYDQASGWPLDAPRLDGRSRVLLDDDEEDNLLREWLLMSRCW